MTRIDKLDSHSVKLSFTKPQPFWADAFCGGRGMIIPKHVFEPFKGSKSREAPANLKPVGTGPYRFVDFKPVDTVRGEMFPAYHAANWPFFDTIEMKGGGDATSAARAVLQTGEFDYAWNLQVEDDVLKRLEQGGKGRVNLWPTGNPEHMQCNFSDPWTEVDGERSSAKTQHPLLSDPAVRQISNNTFVQNGQGASETNALRLYGTDNTVSYNLIQNTKGSGIVVVSPDDGSATAASTDNLISRNSFSGNGGNAMDLVAFTAPGSWKIENSMGDGIHAERRRDRPQRRQPRRRLPRHHEREQGWGHHYDQRHRRHRRHLRRGVPRRPAPGTRTAGSTTAKASSTSALQRWWPAPGRSTSIKINAGLQGNWANGLNAEVVVHHVGSAIYPVDPSFQTFASLSLIPTSAVPTSRVNHYTLLNLRCGYRLCRARVEVAISVFNGLNDRHREHPLADVLGSRVMGWLTLKL